MSLSFFFEWRRENNAHGTPNVRTKKVADFIIDFFANKGIDKMFVVYGAANGDLIDAFTRTNKTKYISIMHEQAA